MLTVQQQEAYSRQGYLVLPELFDEQQMQTLRDAANGIVDNFDPNSTRSVFSTGHESTDRDHYFLTSGDKVRCFFEEDAFAENGELNQPKALSINKIGHALHALEPSFHAFCQQPVWGKIARDLGQTQPEIRQSMYIFKQPSIGGEIRWHQDATYFHTDPISVLTFWLAIEDARLDNGCLQVDKRHETMELKEQFKRYADDTTELVTLNDAPWPLDEDALPLEVKAGTLVVFHGLLPHFSAANMSAFSRHAFTLHVTDGKCTYNSENWLQAPPMPLRV